MKSLSLTLLGFCELLAISSTRSSFTVVTTYSTVDQFPPIFVLFTRTKYPYCNNTLPFIAVFNEPVKAFTTASIALDNAVVSAAPSPLNASYPVQWSFSVQPTNQGVFSVGVSANSLTDLAGLHNPYASEFFWFIYDTVPPAVVSVIPSIPITPYVNMVTLNKTVFTATFGEVSDAVWLSGCLVVWLSGCLVVWLFDCQSGPAMFHDLMVFFCRNRTRTSRHRVWRLSTASPATSPSSHQLCSPST